jgi:hypothetical protein
MEIEIAEPTIEWELEHLQEFNNEKQLRLLRQEIAHIISHGLQVPEGWYDERFEYIYKYSQIDWLNLAKLIIIVTSIYTIHPCTLQDYSMSYSMIGKQNRILIFKHTLA